MSFLTIPVTGTTEGEMKSIQRVLDFYFVQTLIVALTIVTSSDKSNCFGFCGNSIGRLFSQRVPSIFSGRGNNIDEWVSYLEEEFNRSGDGDNIGRDNDLSPDPSSERPFQTPVKTHANAIDLFDQIETALPDDLTIVLFFAHYCKTCQQALVPFKRVAYDLTPSVHFTRFETSSLSPKQFKSLGISRVPFLQIYRSGCLVASFSATEKVNRTLRKLVLRPRLLEQIHACQRRSRSDWLAFREQHGAEIEANKAARAKIRDAMVAENSDGQNAIRDNDDEEEKLYRSVRTLTSETEFFRLIYCGEKDSKERTTDDYGGEGDEYGIVVIMFHSHFDLSCRRAQHKFRKIASERQKKQNEKNRKSRCTMARVESSILPDKTLQQLGIQRYPHIQIYWNANKGLQNDQKMDLKQCVASFSIPRSFLFSKMLHESLDAIDHRTPEEWTEFYVQHWKDIKSKQLAIEEIARKQEL